MTAQRTEAPRWLAVEAYRAIASRRDDALDRWKRTVKVVGKLTEPTWTSGRKQIKRHVRQQLWHRIETRVLTNLFEATAQHALGMPRRS